MKRHKFIIAQTFWFGAKNMLLGQMPEFKNKKWGNINSAMLNSSHSERGRSESVNCMKIDMLSSIIIIHLFHFQIVSLQLHHQNIVI